jgi:hypothetical protein
MRRTSRIRHHGRITTPSASLSRSHAFLGALTGCLKSFLRFDNNTERLYTFFRPKGLALAAIAKML